MSSATQLQTKLTLRRAAVADAAVCGRICYEAFKDIAERHGFPPDFPAPEVAVDVLTMMFGHPKFYSVIAEWDGRVIGSNCLDERTAIGGIGPITVDPCAQNSGAGRALMQEVMRRAAHTTPAGVRLVQGAYHNRSLSLYTKLGFDAQEPLSVFNGDLTPRSIPGVAVRPATAADVAACDALSVHCHGHARTNDFTDGIAQGAARVVERGGRITGYASGLGFFGHAVAETNEDLVALIASATHFVGPGILVPTRNAELMRWCLNNGLRVIFPATLMSRGLYHQPRGAWLPSILY